MSTPLSRPQAPSMQPPRYTQPIKENEKLYSDRQHYLQIFPQQNTGLFSQKRIPNQQVRYPSPNVKHTTMVSNGISHFVLNNLNQQSHSLLPTNRSKHETVKSRIDQILSLCKSDKLLSAKELQAITQAEKEILEAMKQVSLHQSGEEIVNYNSHEPSRDYRAHPSNQQTRQYIESNFAVQSVPLNSEPNSRMNIQLNNRDILQHLPTINSSGSAQFGLGMPDTIPSSHRNGSPSPYMLSNQSQQATSAYFRQSPVDSRVQDPSRPQNKKIDYEMLQVIEELEEKALNQIQKLKGEVRRLNEHIVNLKMEVSKESSRSQALQQKLVEITNSNHQNGQRNSPYLSRSKSFEALENQIHYLRQENHKLNIQLSQKVSSMNGQQELSVYRSIIDELKHQLSSSKETGQINYNIQILLEQGENIRKDTIRLIKMRQHELVQASNINAENISLRNQVARLERQLAQNSVGMQSNTPQSNLKGSMGGNYLEINSRKAIQTGGNYNYEGQGMQRSRQNNQYRTRVAEPKFSTDY